jgi:hypothetical protein
MITPDMVLKAYELAGFEEVNGGFQIADVNKIGSSDLQADIDYLRSMQYTTQTTQTSTNSFNLGGLILPIALIGGALLLLK